MTKEPAQPKEIDLDGAKVPLTPVQIVHRAEGPCVYQLEDGSTLEITFRIGELYKLEGKQSSDGQQLFRFNFQIDPKVLKAAP